MTLTQALAGQTKFDQKRTLNSDEEQRIRDEWFVKAKENKKEAVYRKRDEKNHSDMIYDTKTFLMDHHSIQQFLQTLASINASILITDTEWTLADGTVTTLTTTDIVNIATEIQNRKTNNYKNARDLIANIEAASNYDELNGVDITKGWLP